MDKCIIRYLNENKTELKRQRHYKSQAAELLVETDEFIFNSAQKKYDNACKQIEELENNIKKEGLIDRVNEWMGKFQIKYQNDLQHEEDLQHKKIQEKARKKDIRENYYTNLRKFCKTRRTARYQLRREQRWLNKTEKYFPEWKLKKLKNMPNNKGYIWRGIYYYGYKPAIKGAPVNLFEQKGKKLFIHEITKQFHKVYVKVDKNSKKKLIETRHRRNLLDNQHNLSAFIKT